METEDYIPYQSYENAKDKVYVLSGINEIEIWALFTHMKDSNLYSCSLRSKQKFRHSTDNCLWIYNILLSSFVGLFSAGCLMEVDMNVPVELKI